MQQNTRRIYSIAGIILFFAVVVAGLRIYDSYQDEQARRKAEIVEAAREKRAVDIAQQTYSQILNSLTVISNKNGTARFDEVLRGPAGKYVDESLKSEAAIKTNEYKLIGCRSIISSSLLEKGFTYELASKQSAGVYTVTASWPGSTDGRTDPPSKALATVDVEQEKITAFDCELQDTAADKSAKRNAELEANKQ